MTGQAPDKQAGKRPVRRLLLVGASLLVLAGAGHLGWQYWTTGRFEVSTDDAYVKADSTTIAPKISGYIADVPVGDNEPVKAGQVLARIDDRDFKVALEQAKADVEAARGQHRQQAGRARRPAIHHRRRPGDHCRRPGQPDLRRAGRQALRRPRRQGFGSVQNAQQAAARITAARAAVTRDTAALATAVKQLDVLKAELAQAQAALPEPVPSRTRPN